ncbi:pleiotropic drug resistance protein 2-like [Cocos nucifera]|nr:pleiotropic drug resistance protein 2-like [Cocos nucifera]
MAQEQSRLDQETVSIEIVYISAQSLLYTLLLFSMIGFTWRADNFFWFFYFICMCFIYFVLYGMMIVALTPNHDIAGIVSFFFITLWNLFAGFLVFRPLIPVWWRWYYWASPVAWTIYGVMTSQLGDKENLVEIPGEASSTVKAYLKDNLGYKHSFLGYVALAHAGFVLVFSFVFGYSIKFLNFQKR